MAVLLFSSLVYYYFSCCCVRAVNRIGACVRSLLLLAIIVRCQCVENFLLKSVRNEATEPVEDHSVSLCASELRIEFIATRNML